MEMLTYSEMPNGEMWGKKTPLEIAEWRIKTFNALLAAKAPPQILDVARNQIMKSREELLKCK